jgi:SAM-dependent methyltransferase
VVFLLHFFPAGSQSWNLGFIHEWRIRKNDGCAFSPDAWLCFDTLKNDDTKTGPHDHYTQKAAMTPFKRVSEEEIERINRLQRNSFDELYKVFEPPLPEGVPERLEKIVAHGKINRGDTVLDVGSGTGILIPIIKTYEPRRIYACDLSEVMLEQLSSKKYPNVETIVADVRDLGLPGRSLDVVFINACYPNIVDKTGAFRNLSRMMTPEGRMVISHPLGRSFIRSLRARAPFPLDDFPEKSEAERLFKPFGFEIGTFIDEPKLYILVASKSRSRGAADEVEKL